MSIEGTLTHLWNEHNYNRAWSDFTLEHWCAVVNRQTWSGWEEEHSKEHHSPPWRAVVALEKYPLKHTHGG